MIKKLIPLLPKSKCTPISKIFRMFPNVFAIYRRDEETFQFIQTELNEAGEVQRLKGWRPPIDAKDAAYSGTSWDLGQEWYVEPTDYKGADPILHNCIIHDKAYKWWSSHHKLVWSEYKAYETRDYGSSWSHSPSIPILEFNNKHIYPREYVSVEARWASAMPQDLEAELDKARHSYLTDAHKHVDPSDLRIQTPKEKPQESRQRRSGTPMHSDTESDFDTYERDTEFTPGAPKHYPPVAKHLNYMFETQEELDNSWTPCITLTLLGACLFGTWGVIVAHALGV
jgi:hypothetical protein